MIDERVGQRPGTYPGAGVDDHSGGFVDDDQFRVFINDLYRNRLRISHERSRRGDLAFDQISGAYFVTRFGWSIVDADIVIFDRALNLRATRRSQARCEKNVQTRSSRGSWL